MIYSRGICGWRYLCRNIISWEKYIFCLDKRNRLNTIIYMQNNFSPIDPRIESAVIEAWRELQIGFSWIKSVYDNTSSVWQSPMWIANNYITQLKLRAMQILGEFVRQEGDIWFHAKVAKENIYTGTADKILYTYFATNPFLRRWLFQERKIRELAALEQDRIVATEKRFSYKWYQSWLNLISWNDFLVNALKESTGISEYTFPLSNKELWYGIWMMWIIESEDLRNFKDSIPGIFCIPWGIKLLWISMTDIWIEIVWVKVWNIAFPSEVIERYSYISWDISVPRRIIVDKMNDIPVIKRRFWWNKPSKERMMSEWKFSPIFQWT